MKTLGLHWKPSVDIFTYQYKGEMIKKPTKRNILSKIASIFDPIHFVAPVVVQAKILMQQLWQFKCEWDDVVPSEFLNSWTKFENGLNDLSNIIIPRQVCGTAKIYSPDLHLFCDASEKAYGCTAYFVNNNSDKISSSLVCSKSKVAPLKKTTLPRLELCSAVLATELKIKLTSILQVSINNVFFWTDSMIVLAWLAQPANSWQTFVANRVQFIHNHSELNQWSYVPSKQNPADIVSRGCSPSQLIDNNLYWQGPYWLTQTTLHWPSKVTNEITTKVPEKKKKEFVLTVIDQSKKFYEKYSNFNRLVRVVAYIRRWKTKVLEKNVHLPDYLTSKEIQDATVNVIRLAQQCFSTEIKHLTSGQSVLKCSALHSLNPFIDEKGLLRVNGRLNLGNFPQDKKQPIILPYRNHITNILIEKFHRKHLHVGPQSLLYYIREEYWPINGRKSVTAIVRKCIPCHKVNPKPATQLMGNLPKSRLSPQRPFNVTGIDYAGPIYLKNFTGKAYIAIFVCMLIGAVHLELLLAVTLLTSWRL